MKLTVSKRSRDAVSFALFLYLFEAAKDSALPYRRDKTAHFWIILRKKRQSSTRSFCIVRFSPSPLSRGLSLPSRRRYLQLPSWSHFHIDDNKTTRKWREGISYPLKVITLWLSCLMKTSHKTCSTSVQFDSGSCSAKNLF